MAIDFDVNEKQLPRLLRLVEQQPDSAFTLRLPDGSDYSVYGTLMLIDRAVNRQTGTISSSPTDTERRRLPTRWDELHRACAPAQ